MKTTQCIRTMECGYAVCSAFLPGDRHVSLTCILPVRKIYNPLGGCRNKIRGDLHLRLGILDTYRNDQGTFSHNLVDACSSRPASLGHRQCRQGRQVLGIYA